ncbi:MAG TPA: DNA polymerase III subunit delta' [Vicinamibacteria bacterium]|nr:DNA polymerase III subunit delta' [Vicinamibacteria bacterium]
MGFADVLGHDRVKTILAAALRHGRLPPALLLAGPEGVGKRTLALVVARALVCARGPGDACEECAACSRAARGLHPDLVLVEPDGATIKIDRVRDVAREIGGRPFEARARAFVIDAAHLLTEQAANALLKSLEEPCPTSHVLLVSAAPQALLPTIRSRCQALRLASLPPALLADHLEKRRGLPPEEARLRAVLGGGSLGAALAFEPEAYRGLRDGLLALVEALPRQGPLGRMDAAEKLADVEDLPLALTALRALLRDVAALAAGAPERAALNADVVARLKALASSPLGPRAGALAAAAGETREALRTNANRLLSMDVLLERLAAPAVA